jgi:PAS domain S-box-containing protein
MTELDRPTDRLAATGRLEEVFANVPAAIALLEGPEHRFVLTNPGYRELVAGRDLVGMTVREALPEVVEQGFIDLLDGVFTTGEPFYGSETPVLLHRRGDGTLDEVTVNFVYLPTYGADGAIDGILCHAVEVTELVTARRTVEALAERLEIERRQLETLIEQMPAGVVIGEIPSGRLVAANQTWRDFFGVSLDAFGNVESYAVFSAHHADGGLYAPDEYPLARTVASGEVVVGEQMTIRRADGARRIIEVNSAPIVTEGRTETAVATFFDVTEQRRTAILVEGNKALLELVATGAPLETTLTSLVRMIELHADGTLFASVLLLDRDGIHLRHGAAPSLPAAYNEAIDGIEIGPSAGSCGTAAHRREPVMVADIANDALWADFRDLAIENGLAACWSTPITAASGDVLGTFAIYHSEPREPTADEETLVEVATRTAAVAIERKRLEEDRERLFDAERTARADAERRARASLSLEHVTDGVCLADADGVVGLWNPAAAAITGITATDIMGEPLAERLPALAAAGIDNPSDTESADAATVQVDRAGEELWLAVAASRFAGGVVYTFRDRTSEIRLEQMRAEIVATVSHELRTPLAAVYGAAQTLSRQDVAHDTDLREKFLQMIVGETQRLTRVVGQILLTSELDERAQSPTISEVDVVAVARNAVELASTRPERVTVELVCTGDVHALADAEKLRQVTANLLDNAIKYGASGGRVVVEVANAPRAVRLRVSDFGPGIPAHAAERVFERFYRLDPDQRGGISGTGLGLYICRELVEQMGGRIWLEPNDAAPGATFTVELPRA